MSRRSLTPEDEQLWRRVSATVREMPGRVSQVRGGSEPKPGSPRIVLPPPTRSVDGGKGSPSRPARVGQQPLGLLAGLDRGWDRRLANGAVIPDRTLDLHGHTLASAHAALDAGLDRAIRAGDRVVLLVTGRPPRKDSERPHARGAIRSQIADWLALSRHGDRIAAVRGAHPRHGGQGALYVILRRHR